MPKESGPYWFAWLTVKTGISANEALRMAQAAGFGIRRETFLKLVGEIKTSYARSQQEFDLPLNRRPVGPEITTLTGSSAGGYIQYVSLFVRNKLTGLVDTVDRSLRTQSLMSRQRAIDLITTREELNIAKAPAEGGDWGTLPDWQILGAVYTATHQFAP